MNIKRITLGVLFAISILILALYSWSGGFFNPEISEKEAGPFLFVGIPHKGAYPKISPKFKEVNDKVKTLSIPIDPMAGIYYDDPSTVPEEKLRSYAGFITTNENAKLVVEKFPEFKIISIPKQLFLSSEFPNRNYFSMILAIIKTYPKFSEYVEVNKIPIDTYMEIDFESKFSLEVYHKDRVEFLLTFSKK